MESPPPLARYIHQKSKKRLFPRVSSSYMDPEVVDISSRIKRSSKSKLLKQEEVICSKVINVDMDEGFGDVMLIDGKVAPSNKGKEALANFSFGPSGAATVGSMDGFQSSKKSCAPGSQNPTNLDGFNSDLSYGDDEYIDMYCDDSVDDDYYTILQSHFDNMDIPPGIESPIPWFPVSDQYKNKSATTSSSAHSILRTQSDAEELPPVTDSSLSLGLPDPALIRKKSTSKSSSSLQSQVDAVSYLQKVDLSSSWSFAEPSRSNKNIAAAPSSTSSSSQTQRGAVNLPSGLKPFKYGKRKSAVFGGTSYSRDQLGGMNQSAGIDPFHWSYFPNSKRKPAVSGGTSYYSSGDQLSGMKQSAGIDTIGGSYFPNSTKKQVGNGSPYSSFNISMDLIKEKLSLMSAPAYSGFIDPFDGVDFFAEEEAYGPEVQDPDKSEKTATDIGSSTIPSESSSSIENYGNEDEILKKFKLFKKFDTIQDHSDHHYSRNGSSLKQPSKDWAKKIQEEWRILEKDLPDAIFVRVYESRMDLLRAVIVGAEGTPYHDGLFFFDVLFPSSYPNVPPLVYYHSGGLQINPNLYFTGKVCLSLLNTWIGSQQEKWIPGVSTMLQVLVSIQGLILNAKPFFNEPGRAEMNGVASAEQNSLQYNEDTFILSLKTMLYTMRRPPKHFENLVMGHFCKHAHDILVACKAYVDGAQVGSLVRGDVQDVDEGDRNSSYSFKQTVAGCIETLVKAFKRVGAKDCEKFLSPAQMENSLVSLAPDAANYH